ncbi:phosphoribosyl-AMP cyclohydrolase [Streptococcus gallolyticus]|uniref:phosphoribosyl-AMP cyclohydrolase n=1 Tax=Streptococcus hepaticus TaxID=3349163 RepID=UPI001C947FE7|nr:phosphoribosyl-AMP cyclohydrolase [Streptococcus gallolyticus]MBY5041321.1 phosphoribosyl-AMP cyclohydrolase [Streptococcus gallolyticus]
MTAIKLDFDKQDGLMPVIVTDHKTKQVLMLAYMNEEAFEQTKKTKQMHYWSRSRQEIWHKGATSGHYQDVVGLSTDCDQDTLLAEVKQTGAACHTGAYSCFFTPIDLN